MASRVPGWWHVTEPGKSTMTLERLDALAFRLENGLLKLVEALERKRISGDWVDTLMVQESNAVCDVAPGELANGQGRMKEAPP